MFRYVWPLNYSTSTYILNNVLWEKSVTVDTAGSFCKDCDIDCDWTKYLSSNAVPNQQHAPGNWSWNTHKANMYLFIYSFSTYPIISLAHAVILLTETAGYCWYRSVVYSFIKCCIRRWFQCFKKIFIQSCVIIQQGSEKEDFCIADNNP